MKFLKVLFAIFIFTLVIKCEKENQEIDIKGDWYRCDLFPDPSGSSKNNYLYYEEYFYTDSIMFSYTNYGGYLSPTRFHIKNDSLFIALIGVPNFEFRGRIKMISNNHFIFYDDLFKVNYYRLTNTTEVLSKYMIDLNTDTPIIQDTDLTFGRAFRLRINDCQAKTGDTIN